MILKVNVDQQGALAQQAGVRSIPDTRLYYAGQELERRIGGLNNTLLREMVLEHAGRLPAPARGGSQRVAGSPARTKPMPTRPSIIPLSKTGNASARTTAQDVVPRDAPESGTIVPMDDDWLPPGVTRE